MARSVPHSPATVRRAPNAPSSAYTERHALESSPFTHLYYVLWKRRTQWWLYEGEGTDKKKRSGQFRIPDTVVWENNIPKAWYHWDPKEGVVRKKVDSNGIVRHFTKQVVDREHEVVACLYTKQASHDDQQDEFAVEYLNVAMLTDFLFVKRHGKGCCALQEFKVLDSPHNDIVQAIWSPCVSLVNRRQNKYALKDPKVSLFAKAATFEGPPHLSHSVYCTPKLVKMVRACCEEVAAHFEGIDSRNTLSRMVLHLKIDCKSRMWLLNCAAAKVVSSSAKGLASSVTNALDLNFPLVPALGTQAQGPSYEELCREQADRMDSLMQVSHALIQSQAENGAGSGPLEYYSLDASPSRTPPCSPILIADSPKFPEGDGSPRDVDPHFGAAVTGLLRAKRRRKRGKALPTEEPERRQLPGHTTPPLPEQQPAEENREETLQWLGKVASSPTLHDHVKLQLLLRVLHAPAPESPVQHWTPQPSSPSRATRAVDHEPAAPSLDARGLLDWMEDLLYRAYSHETLETQTADRLNHSGRGPKGEVGQQFSRLRARFLTRVSAADAPAIALEPPISPKSAASGSPTYASLAAEDSPSPKAFAPATSKGALSKPFLFEMAEGRIPRAVREMVADAMQAVPVPGSGQWAMVEHIPYPTLTNRFDAIRQYIRSRGASLVSSSQLV
eukprot:EG_transcript_5506